MNTQAPEKNAENYPAQLFERHPFLEITDDYLPDSVRVVFHFNDHTSAEDFDETKKLFPDANIFIPELASWTEKSLRSFNAVSKGNYKAYQQELQLARKDPDTFQYRRELLTAIYMHGKFKPITFIDASRQQMPKQTPRPETHPTLDDALEDVALAHAETAYEAALRDHIMINNLGPKVSTTVSHHPKLRDKDEVLVLCTLGSAHHAVYTHLKDSKSTSDKVQATFVPGVKEAGFGYHADVIELYMQSKLPTKQQIIKCLIWMALRHTSLGENGITYIPAGLHYSNPLVKAGYTMLELMAADADKGAAELALAMLNQTLKADDVRMLDQYANRARIPHSNT